MGNIPMLTLGYVIDWGWLRIGPPYIYINIDPVIVHLGPLALRWYGLMYVVAIVIAFWGIQRYTRRKGMSEDIVYRLLWWCIVAGLIGGRLYFVVQQPDLVPHYILQPWRILATWEGGMAFFGAIFLIIPVLFWRARAERINPLVAIDAGVLFAAIGQIFGRIGNLINGDIIGYRSTLPWSTVYQHPASWACLNPATCNVPVQPAAGYELLANLALLAVMYFFAYRLRRPGTLMLIYLFGYCITQFFLFFERDNIIVSFLGLNWGLKQAQWTALVLFIALFPISYLVFRYSKQVPPGEVPATYGIPQKTTQKADADTPAAAYTVQQQPEEVNGTGAAIGVEEETKIEEAENPPPQVELAGTESQASNGQQPPPQADVVGNGNEPPAESQPMEEVKTQEPGDAQSPAPAEVQILEEDEKEDTEPRMKVVRKDT